jgi:hypothetical protein
MLRDEVKLFRLFRKCVAHGIASKLFPALQIQPEISFHPSIAGSALRNRISERQFSRVAAKRTVALKTPKRLNIHPATVETDRPSQGRKNVRQNGGRKPGLHSSK